MRHRMLLASVATFGALLIQTAPACAGVVNPDISLIGQPVVRWTDDPSDTRAYRQLGFDVGETEIVFDSALNPYARGYATLSLASGKADVEEAYFTILRGLPAGLEVKGGKYRVGFGKLNAAHPHTYPFIERFHVLAKFLPGDDSYDETGVNVSGRIPVPGDIALTASADILQGDSFQSAADSVSRGKAKAHNAYVGRLSAFIPIGDRSGLELGASGTQGVNDIYSGAKTTVFGGDAKLKLYVSDNASLLIQAEYLHEDREVTEDTPIFGHWKPNGGYAFVNYSWAQRYNVGMSFERSSHFAVVGDDDSSVGAFVGLALMEETTWFRLGFEHTTPGPANNNVGDFYVPAPGSINTVRLGIVYSMGPHKAHQF
jgi:hypothetical protein